MFIVSKRNYKVRRADGSSFFIAKDFIGNIPQDVAQSNLVQRAVRGGMIAVPEGTKDRQLEEAENKAGERVAEKDIRPDAAGKKAEVEEQTGEKGTESGNPESSEGKESAKRSQKK